MSADEFDVAVVEKGISKVDLGTLLTSSVETIEVKIETCSVQQKMNKMKV